MAEVRTEDAVLHVEVDGEGGPVTVLAHGLTNSCKELADLTPLVPGTKVRFCFRGHGHSSSPETGYRFPDFARDVQAVADAYGATIAFGTSLGAGAISNLVSGHPDRFEKLVFLLPAGLDLPFQYKPRMLRMANYQLHPWLEAFDRRLLEGLNPVGVPRAIREIIDDWPLRDRQEMGKVTAPTLIICREGDEIHPAIVGRILVDIMPNAELVMFEDAMAMYQGIPDIVTKVNEFIRS